MACIYELDNAHTKCIAQSSVAKIGGSFSLTPYTFQEVDAFRPKIIAYLPEDSQSRD